MKRNYWLLKSEPDVYSISDLQKEPRKTAYWDGIRNYQARNFIRDTMKKGDGILFYHSRIAEPAIVGTAEVVKEAYPDPTATDSSSKYFEPKQTAENIIWYVVDIRFVSEFKAPLTRSDLKNIRGLEEMMVLKKGMRLSIQPVTAAEWKIINRKGGVKA